MSHRSRHADRDAPLFAPDAFRLGDEEAALIAKARRFGARVLAPRAAQHDRDATFPIENYRDMHPAGLLAHLHPEGAWRARRRLPDLLPRRRRDRPLLRRHRALLEHACVLDAVVGRARRRSGHERGRARRARTRGGDALPPHRRGRRDLFAALLRGRRRGGGRGGLRHAKPGRWRAAGSSTARRSSPRSSGAADYYGVLCTERAEGEAASRPQHALSRHPGQCATGVSVVGDWDPLGMRGTVSRTLIFKDVFVAGDASADAARRLFPGGDALAAHVPHAVADLHGPRAGGLRFHRRISARRGARHAAGEAAHVSRPSRSPSPRCA